MICMTGKWKTDRAEVSRMKKRRGLFSVLGALIPDEINAAGKMKDPDDEASGMADGYLRDEYVRFFWEVIEKEQPEIAEDLTEAEMNSRVSIEAYRGNIYAEYVSEDFSAYCVFDDECRKVSRLEINGEPISVEQSHAR